MRKNVNTPDASRWHRSDRTGAMMLEIIVAVVILGVIASIAAPRLFGDAPF